MKLPKSGNKKSKIPAKKFQKGTSQYIKDRLRKEGRYTVLNTRSLQLSKIHQCYQKSKQVAKNDNIKQQKNFNILVFRISLAYSKITFLDKLAPKQAIKTIFNYLQKNIQKLTYKKYKQDDDENFKKAVIQSSKRDAKTLRTIFSGDIQNRQQLKDSMFSLFTPNKNGNFVKKQRDSANKLTDIVLKYSKYYSDNNQTGVSQNQSIQEAPNNGEQEIQIQQQQNEDDDNDQISIADSNGSLFICFGLDYPVPRQDDIFERQDLNENRTYWS